MPKVLLQAWEKYFAIQHAQPEDTNELFQKLLEDLHIINEELVEYINSPSWNTSTFYNNYEEHSIQYKEYLKNSSNSITTSNFNQEKENPPQNFDIHQLVREECGIKVYEKQKQNMEDTLLVLLKVCRQKEFYCMHNDVDDLIESALNSKLLSINLRSQLFTTFSNPLFDDNDDFTSSDDESLSDEDVSMEDFKVYSNPLFNDDEINSDKMIRHFLVLLQKPPDVEFFFDLEPNLISAVMNNIYELNKNECFDPGGEINVFENVKDDDYFPFIFVIRIFLPYLIYLEVSPLLLFAESEDTIFDPGISV
nr:hypothetical protein [Tanacetum cinerariifolium]